MLTLKSLLSLYWPDPPDGRVRMLRHKHSRLEEISSLEDVFIEYQGFQSGDKLKDTDYVISFLRRNGSSCEFRGIYKILETRSRSRRNLPKVSGRLLELDPNAERGCDFFYKMQRTAIAEELIGRLRIDWISVGSDKASQNWIQWLDKQRKPVTEIRPADNAPTFPGFDRVHLTRDELESMFGRSEGTEAWRIWKDLLSRVAAVYLITTGEGQQYVGSAYGENALWGRWCTYANDPSGGNLLLRQLMESSPGIERTFRYSILATLPFTSEKDTVFKTESWFKQVLGSRVFGLNAN